MHALITGGSSGIGLALARRLAAQGYSLSLVARRAALLDDAAAALRPLLAPGQRVLTFPADVGDGRQAAHAVAEAIAALGTPDLVVTSAGIAIPGYFEDVPLEVFERTMRVNYMGTVAVLRAALPSMRARRKGRVVLVSSGAAFTGIFGYGAYGPTKFAVRGLAETLQAELRADNVAVSIVYPPDTDTPQLVEENKTKPEETALITGIASVWSGEAVADCVMKGIARNAFAITPGATLTLMHRMPGLVIPVLRWYCDKLVARLQRRRAREGRKPERPAFSGAD
jgi:3-dehydrosphinganine reductase